MSHKISPEIHKLLGTFKATRHANQAPEAPGSTVMQGRPKRPSSLTPDARREWNRLVPQLEARGSITPADGPALLLHCEIWARWLNCQKQLQKDGVVITTTFFSKSGEERTALKQHPALKIAQDCERSLRQSLHSFGMTPQSRERVTPAAEPPKPAPEHSGVSAADIMSFGKKE
jgi:P27 family predicted phage terminase small subunit